MLAQLSSFLLWSYAALPFVDGFSPLSPLSTPLRRSNDVSASLQMAQSAGAHQEAVGGAKQQAPAVDDPK